MGAEEKRRYDDARDRYLDQITFTVQSDKEDLDRILFMELMIFRWSTWLMRGKEYDDTLVTNENELRRWVQDWGDRLQRIKESLKLDRKTREGDQAANFDQRWQQLAAHAREMGVMREGQCTRAIEIMQGLFSVVGAFDRSDLEERKRLGFETTEDIVQYIRDTKPAFDEVDEYFREHSQRFWIRSP